MATEGLMARSRLHVLVKDTVQSENGLGGNVGGEGSIYCLLHLGNRNLLQGAFTASIDWPSHWCVYVIFEPYSQSPTH
jgi:hypothetical protein